VIVGTVDLISSTVVGIHGQLTDRASNLSWFILAFYVPFLWVSMVMIVWQLVSRQRASEPSPAISRREARWGHDPLWTSAPDPRRRAIVPSSRTRSRGEGRDSADGRALASAIITPATIFGEMALLGNGCTTSSAKVLNDAVDCVAGRAYLQRLLLGDPRIAARITDIPGQRLASLAERQRRTSRSPPWRARSRETLRRSWAISLIAACSGSPGSAHSPRPDRHRRGTGDWPAQRSATRQHPRRRPATRADQLRARLAANDAC